MFMEYCDKADNLTDKIREVIHQINLNHFKETNRKTCISASFGMCSFYFYLALFLCQHNVNLLVLSVETDPC